MDVASPSCRLFLEFQAFLIDKNDLYMLFSYHIWCVDAIFVDAVEKYHRAVVLQRAMAVVFFIRIDGDI